ncbi:hypothetical protein H6F77_19285 [Microcoleus sp. FACHB-831]|nr:hypothetical protein [Microcoleus sp. FACHB-831]
MINYYNTNRASRNRLFTFMDKKEIEALGTSLRRISQKLLSQNSQNGTKRVWFQGGEAYFDLVIDVRDDEIQWFQFTLRGKSISWNKQRPGLQTGITNELRVDDMTFYPASKLIQTDSKEDSEFIGLARSILQTRVGEELFDKMLAVFDTH